MTAVRWNQKTIRILFVSDITHNSDTLLCIQFELLIICFIVLCKHCQYFKRHINCIAHYKTRFIRKFDLFACLRTAVCFSVSFSVQLCVLLCAFSEIFHAALLLSNCYAYCFTCDDRLFHHIEQLNLKTNAIFMPLFILLFCFFSSLFFFSFVNNVFNT